LLTPSPIRRPRSRRRLSPTRRKTARPSANAALPGVEVTSLFGLVDGARDPRLYDLTVQSEEWACLFGGKIAPEMVRVAPYLARLTAQCPLYGAWSKEGWGQSWGITCMAYGSLSEVRRHFRQFLQAKLPDGREVLFRFYDPRVWRVYLPTCNAEELKGWFAFVEEFAAEGPN